MDAGTVETETYRRRSWTVFRLVGALAGFALAVRLVVWVLGAGWEGQSVGEFLAIVQPIGYALRAGPGVFLAVLGTLTLLAVPDDGSRASRAFWMGGLLLVVLAFLTATAWVGWAPPR